MQRKKNIVGEFIKSRRKALSLSQRNLGLKLSPPVTTQFISNIERGITPVPKSHVAKIAQSLNVSSDTLAKLLEQEYAAKISLELGIQAPIISNINFLTTHDFEFFSTLYATFSTSSLESQKNFKQICKQILKLDID